MAETYSFTGFYIAFAMALLFNIVGVIMAFVAASNIVIASTAALSATITANNKTAVDLLNFAGYIGILSIIILFILLLIIIFMRNPLLTRSFTEADYYAARFGWGTWLLIILEIIILIAATLLAFVGISYINTSTANNDSSSARTYGIIAAIAYIVVMFPVFYIIYSIYSYNSYLYSFIVIPGAPVPESKNTALFSINTNPNFPGTVLEGKISVDTVYQPYNTIIYKDGVPIQSDTKPKPITQRDVFDYADKRVQTTIVPEKVDTVSTTTPSTTVPIRRNINPFNSPSNVPLQYEKV